MHHDTHVMIKQFSFKHTRMLSIFIKTDNIQRLGMSTLHCHAHRRKQEQKQEGMMSYHNQKDQNT